MKTGDAELEERILEDVASYGRQLGWITDVMELVVKKLKPTDLTEEETAALHQFQKLVSGIKKVKQKS